MKMFPTNYGLGSINSLNSESIDTKGRIHRF